MLLFRILYGKKFQEFKNKPYHQEIYSFFKEKIQYINGVNNLTFVMDYGESESIILYKEIQADYLLIDDNKARSFAESVDIRCIGTIGLLAVSKEMDFIKNLKPQFVKLLKNKRFYSVDLLNSVLKQNGEGALLF
jgi:hypothetical protein